MSDEPKRLTCPNCGDQREGTDAIFTDGVFVWHTEGDCIASLREQLAAAKQRAEKAETENAQRSRILLQQQVQLTVLQTKETNLTAELSQAKTEIETFKRYPLLKSEQDQRAAEAMVIRDGEVSDLKAARKRDNDSHNRLHEDLKARALAQVNELLVERDKAQLRADCAEAEVARLRAALASPEEPKDV